MYQEEFIKKFKPLCDTLITIYNRGAIFNYNKFIKATTTELIIKFKEPIVVPLVITLEKFKLSSDEKQVILETLQFVLNLSLIKNVRELLKLYTLVFDQISDDNPNNSEELKECVLKTAILLIIILPDKLGLELYSKPFAPQISYGVLTALKLAQSERKKEIRILALNFLLKISKHESENLQLRHSVADIFMLFLPGVIGGLKDIIYRDEKQHHEIVVLAVRNLGHILSLVLEDMELTNTNVIDNSVLNEWVTGCYKKPENSIENVAEVLKETIRSQKWAQAAAKTLQPTLLLIFEKVLHSQWSVRHEYAIAVTSLLENSCTTFGSDILPILEVLLSLTDDENAQVRRIAELGVENFKKKCAVFPEMQSFVQKNFHIFLGKVTKRVQSSKDEEIYLSLRLLRGYIELLGELNVMRSPVYIRQLILFLETICKIELSENILNTDVILGLDDSSVNMGKVYKYHQLATIIYELEKISYLISKYGDAHIVVDYLLDDFSKESCSIESIIVLNLIVGGWTEPKENLVNTLMDFYLGRNRDQTLVLWNGAEETTQDKKRRILQDALFVEGLGKLSIALKEKYSNWLLKTIYFLVERIGSNYVIINNSAKIAAKEVASACGFDSTLSLIQNNIDYLRYHVNIRLRRSDESVFRVIHVIIKNSPMEALPSLQEIISKVISSSSESFNPSTIVSYLKVFRTFVEYVAIVYPPAVTNFSTEKMCPFKALSEFIKSQKIENDMDDDEQPEVESNEETSTPECEIPLHVKITIAVIRRCLNYLPSKTDERKILALEVLNMGLKIISPWENELLPLVHEIWSPLVNRFDANSNCLILNRSFRLVLTMSLLAKDFIRSRTLKDILPNLRTFLVKSALRSRGKDSGSGYYTTQQFKLQLELLSGLGLLAVHLRVRERNIDEIITAALPYLSAFQPIPLQLVCKELFGHILGYDPTAVIHRLMPLETQNEYAKNVLNILHTST